MAKRGRPVSAARLNRDESVSRSKKEAAEPLDPLVPATAPFQRGAIEFARCAASSLQPHPILFAVVGGASGSVGSPGAFQAQCQVSP